LLGDCALPEEVHIALYRMAQEALNNVVKHAQASRVEVSLRCTPRDCEAGPTDVTAHHGDSEQLPERYAELVIRDNGRGFTDDEPAPGELGLSIMKERCNAIGASLYLHSVPGEGTRVTIVWRETEERPSPSACEATKEVIHASRKTGRTN
jgi:nitrate/nitrite-specific signal transduction histidine kinase